MKVAVVVERFPCISETFILNQITGLIEAGHDVRIFSFKKSENDKTHHAIRQFRLMNRTKYLRQMPRNKTWLRVLTLLLIVFYGVRYPITLCQALRYLLFQDPKYFYLRLHFLFLIISSKADVYHFHFGETGRLIGFLKAVGLSGKMIVSFHGYDINQVPVQKGEDYYSELFYAADHFTANSNFTKEQMISLGCPAEKISVIPVGFSVSDCVYRERTYPASGPVRILTVGRLVEKKGYQFSIPAIAKLIQQGFPIHYIIVGEGLLQAELQNLAAQLCVTEHITFAGELTQEEVSQMYNTSHLFVLASATASTGDREGQGLVLQEAQACGLPVVSTFHNGIPEGVLHGESGILVPEKDIEALSNAIKELLMNPSLWLSMGRIGRSFVGTKYDVKNIIRQTVDLYEKV